MITGIERHKAFVEEMRKNMTKLKINKKSSEIVEAQTDDTDNDELRLEIERKFDELFGPETVVAGLVFYGGKLHECRHRIVFGVGFQVCPAACRIGPVAENLREHHIFEVIADMICHDFSFETDRALVPEVLIASIFQTAFPFFHKCGKVGCESCGIQDHRSVQPCP